MMGELIPTKRVSYKPLGGGGAGWRINPSTKWGMYTAYMLTQKGGRLGAKRRVEENMILDVELPLDQLRGMAPDTESETDENDVSAREEPSTPTFWSQGAEDGRGPQGRVPSAQLIRGWRSPLLLYLLQICQCLTELFLFMRFLHLLFILLGTVHLFLFLVDLPRERELERKMQRELGKGMER